MKKISVIIPVYNVEKYIEKCLKTILNQTYKNIEIILIDDGSTDNSGKICDIYAKKDNRIKVKHIKNKGVSNARNIGILEASGDYITFVDSDDYLEFSTYQKVINFFEKENVDICVFNYYLVKNSHIKIHHNKNRIPKIMDVNTYLSIMCTNNFGGMMWNKVYKKKLLLNNQINIDNHLTILEDLLFNCELCEENTSLKVGYLNKAYYYYVVREGSTLNQLFSEKSLDSIYAQIKIIKVLNEMNNVSKDTFELNFLINAKYMLNEMKINNYQNVKFKNLVNEQINEIIKNGIYRRHASVLLKFKCYIYIYFEKLYFRLRGKY